MRRIAEELVRLAREMEAGASVGSSVKLLKPARTKLGVEFQAGEDVRVDSYSDRYPWTVRVSAPDGRKLSLLVEYAWKGLSGFAKPPSLSTMERWSEDGVARAVDGARTEPDGFSTSGAPSWMLVMGMI